MARKFPDRVHVSCATTGAGTLTLSTAFAADKRAMPSSIDGHTVDYTIVDGSAWEVGTGVYTHSGTTLTRSLIASSTGSLLSLSGASQVFVTIASQTMEQAMAGIDVIQAVTSFPTLSPTFVDITNIPATYRQLQLVISGMSPAAGLATELTILVSNDNGSSFATSNYMGLFADATANAQIALTASLSGTPSMTMTTAAVQDRTVLISAYQGGAYAFAETVGHLVDASQSLDRYYASRCAYMGSTAAINALRINLARAFDAGTYALYGIR
ncbi:MAG: hypothetical protein ABL897_02765 [Hyphomicrobium sp.]